VEKKIGKEALIKETPVRKRRSSAELVASSEAAPETIPISDFQSHTQEIIASRFAEIIAAMAQKSAEGSLSHTKYLFDIGGVKDELQQQGQDNDEPTLAELLLAEVRRHQTEQAQTSGAAGSGALDQVEASTESYLEQHGDVRQSIMNCGAKAQ
jgi:hypothetical protein